MILCTIVGQARMAVGAQFGAIGVERAVMILSLLGINLLISPVLLRSALIRSGEAGRKQAAGFADH